MNIEKLFSMGKKLISALDLNLDQSAIDSLAASMYEEIVKKYKPLAGAAPVLLEKLTADLTPIFGEMFSVLNKMEAPVFKGELKVYRVNRAISRSECLQIYLNSGFTREEAFSLLVVDIANTKANLQNVSNYNKE